MAAPFITNFGDESHDFGETSLTIDGFEFGFFVGEVWIFANADRSGASDDITPAGGQSDWGEQQITNVAIPGTPNNAAGTVWLAVKTAENEWSSPAFPFSFTLVDPGAAGRIMCSLVGAGGLAGEGGLAGIGGGLAG